MRKTAWHATSVGPNAGSSAFTVLEAVRPRQRDRRACGVALVHPTLSLFQYCGVHFKPDCRYESGSGKGSVVVWGARDGFGVRGTASARGTSARVEMPAVICDP